MSKPVDGSRMRERAHLGRCLEVARTAAGLTQAQVAVALGVTRQTIGSFEAGEREPLALDLVKLADLYGISLDALCGRAAIEVPQQARVVASRP